MTQTEPARRGPAAGVCPVHNFNYSDRRPAGTWFARYDELRRQSPVYWNEFGPGFWTVVNHEGILEVLQNPETFSSSVVTALDPNPPFKWIPEMLDGDEHHQWRRQLGPLFSPKFVESLDDRIRARAIEIIEQIQAKGSGTAEFMEDFAYRFPTTIFLELMGLPVEELPQFLEWEDAILHVQTEKDAAPEERGDVAAMMAVVGRFMAVIAERRAEPRDDIVSKALAFEIDGQPVKDEDLLSFCLLMFIAGLDTVSVSLGWALRHLATHPADRARIVAEPDLIPSAIEEILRTYAIVIPARKVMADIEIQGCPMKAGDMVAVPLNAATRDDVAFENATEFDITRSPNNHIAFGAGPHRCLGSHLARREMRIALEEWHRRIPDYHLASGSELVENGGLLGLTGLPLEWEPS